MRTCISCNETFADIEANFHKKDEKYYMSYCKPCHCAKVRNRSLGTPSVYCVTCPDGKFYWGSTSAKVEKRLNHHFLGVRTRPSALSVYLRENSIAKEDVVVATTYCDSIADARALERELILRDYEDPNCLNRTIPSGRRLKTDAKLQESV